MQFDGWMILVAFIGIIGAFISLAIASDAHTSRGMLSGAITLWLIGYGVVTVIVMVGAQVNKPSVPHNTPLSYTYVAENMGLYQGTEYPLMLGGRTGGSSGETNVSTSVRGGLFSARATTTMQSSTTPASAVSLGYSYEGKTYILDMPTSRITFEQSETKKPSVAIWFHEGTTSDFGQNVYSPYAATDCKWTFNNILWMCLWPPYEGESAPVITQHAFDVGLAPVVQGGFDRATITLTPEMYRQLLGVIE